jgi:hypothetical protein
MTNAEKLQNHRESYAKCKPLVICAKCGGTNLDQNSITELRCYTCDNSMPFDATKFSIRRYDGPEGEDDVMDAFITADKWSHRRQPS